MTPHIDLLGLAPELAVTLTLGCVFVLDLIVGEGRRGYVTALAVAGVTSALACTVVLGVSHHHSSMLGSAYVVDNFSLVAKGLFLASGAVVFLLGAPTPWKGEYCVLLLCSLLGMVMVVSSRDVLTFFVTFELLAVPGYMLVGWNKRSSHGPEAALKYYLLGVIATAVMLYGISLLFGLADGTLFSQVSAAMEGPGGQSALARLAVLFVISGMAFKISAVPFHFWAPDAYQGAPVPVAAFLSVVSKAAGLLALVELLALAFPAADAVYSPLLWVLAALSMTIGNLVALRQTDIVRLLAYSSIAQAGYLLVPLAVARRHHGGVDLVLESVVEYLVIYAATNLGTFAVVVAVARRTGETSLNAYRGLFRSSPVLASLMTVFLLSLAGIPPLGGWIAKLVVFRASIDAGTPAAVSLVVVAAFNTAIGLVYYAAVVRRMWEQREVERLSAVETPALVLALGLAAASVVISGLAPGVVTYVGGLTSFTR